MKKNKQVTLALLLGLSGIIGFQNADVLAQTVKQLKEPAAPTEVQIDEGTTATEDLPTTQNNPNGGSNSSYSVVIENKMGKDGKMVQTKKVWKNGVLTEESEKILEPGEEGDAAIELSDGEIAPGMILRSERFGDFPFQGFGIPEEQMKEIRKQMEQLQEQMQKFDRHYFNGFRFAVPGTAPENNESSKEGTQDISPNFQIVPGTNAQTSNIKLSEYWIGALVEPLPELIASQMSINAGEGVLVLQIVPNSPAEKAGLKKYDVIVKIGDNAVKNVFDIGQILDQDGNKVQKVEFYRKGQLESLELTPEKRPDEPVGTSFQIVPGNTEMTPGQSIKIVRPGMIISGTPEQAEENNEISESQQTGENKSVDEPETQIIQQNNNNEEPVQPESQPQE
ncbi:MAG: PDZ domain-containing protein [Planctomycetia bacterium]|nr:PDZ domain-containing protein [Planctomycetia bacterium]